MTPAEKPGFLGRLHRPPFFDGSLAVGLGVFIAATLAFQNCSSTSTSTSASPAQSASDTAGGSNTNLSFAGNPLITERQLIGTWDSSNCQALSSGQNSSSMSFQFGYSNQFVIVTPLFNGTTCSGNPLLTMQFGGTYALGALDANVAGTTDVVFTFNQSVNMTPFDSAGASALNQVQYCGFTNWQALTATPVAVGDPCLQGQTLPSGSSLLGMSGFVLYTGGTAIDPASAFQFEGTNTTNLPVPN